MNKVKKLGGNIIKIKAIKHFLKDSSFLEVIYAQSNNTFFVNTVIPSNIQISEEY